MSWFTQTLSSSIGRKFAMALSALFLLIFLLQHLLINILSVFSKDMFNEVSEFMGTNPVVQFVLQPVLFFGIMYHFVMGFILEAKNRNARHRQYAMSKPQVNTTWMSRNMIYSGLVILAFLGLHMVDFFFPSINAHYFTHEELDSYALVADKFADLLYVALYSVAFVLLALHLWHGFQSAFQSVGIRHPKYTPLVIKLGKAYAVGIPSGFIFIAVFHYINSL